MGNCALSQQTGVNKVLARTAAVDACVGTLPPQPDNSLTQLPPFSWLDALPRRQLQCLRRCQSPTAARAVLLEVLRAPSESQRPTAPSALLDDLRKLAQVEQQRALDIEEELRQQAVVYEAELAA